MTDQPLAKPLDTYPELTSAVSEDDLYRAMAGGLQARPCACGGVVIANPENPQPGMDEHYATPRHTHWRAWVET